MSHERNSVLQRISATAAADNTSVIHLYSGAMSFKILLIKGTRSISYRRYRMDLGNYAP